MKYTELQLSVSTADEERACSCGPFSSAPQPDISAHLPAGVYRVVEGTLCRIVPGVPPGFAAKFSADEKRTA
jgi:hypothetical protein